MSRPVCATCGSFDVSLETTAAYWNAGTGQAEVSDLCDKGHYCNTCDGEVRLRWIKTVSPEVTEQECDTILAALRWWQQMEMYNPEVGDRRGREQLSIAAWHGPVLDAKGIDALVDRINTQ